MQIRQRPLGSPLPAEAHSRRAERSTDRLVIDTDGGIDDFLAVIAAARLAAARITAITTGGGNTSAANSARNSALAAAIGGLDLAHVTIGLGSDLSLSGTRFRNIADTYHTIEGIPLARRELERRTPPHTASESLVVLRESCYAPVTFMCLGPLTNIARLCSQAPECCANVKQIIAMAGTAEGGLHALRSRKAPARLKPDFNVSTDPQAAIEAFSFFCGRVLLVPKQICDAITVQPQEILERLNSDRVEHQLVRKWYRFRRSQPGKSTSLRLGDPLTALVACGLCEYVEKRAILNVEAEITTRSGASSLSTSKVAVRVVCRIDEQFAKAMLWRVLFEG